ncbi:MAG TPA: AIR synthase related protein [Solirubrobacteraceae bacterium]|nr:AIR synthase related protein [Solirubrobacteraceae bacterium]
MSEGSANYKAAGVDYDALDEGKRMAMARALATSSLLDLRGGRALDASRGEPAFVFEFGDTTLAFVMEGLGTKSVIARQLLERHGVNRFADVAYDTVAAILNDLCCVGALPLVVNAYFATGASEWYAESERAAALLEGWQRACIDAGCAWGGGESPSLPGLVAAADIELAGAAVGAVPASRSAILGEQLQAGDEIVLVASSGLHANGASLARLLVERLPDGYMTGLPSGRALGEALLDASLMYVSLVQALMESDLGISYLSHVTGHGLLKLMRPAKALSYRISRLPPVPEVLAFLAEQAGLDEHAAYSTFNMGSGYAVYCSGGTGPDVVEMARRLGFQAVVAGSVEAGARQVILEPIGVRYVGDELDLSASAHPPS